MGKIFEQNGIRFECCDCMERLRTTPDKYYQLAVVDTPYGTGGGVWHTSDGTRFGGRFDKYKRDAFKKMDTLRGNVSVEHIERGNQHKGKHETAGGDGTGKKMIAWDVAPPKEYFDELFRVSRNQIIFGGNYFSLPPTRCFVVYRKTNIPAKGFSMSPIEYAWTSFWKNAVYIEAFAQSVGREKRWHPTAKPVSLYKELLENFAQPGDKILDTHVGSASSLVACYEMGFEATGYEIDEYYFDKACERLEEEMAQVRMEV